MTSSSLLKATATGSATAWIKCLLSLVMTFSGVCVCADQITHKQFLYDADNRLTFQEVASETFEEFDGTIQRRFETGTLWIKLHIHRRGSEELHLKFDTPTSDKVSVITLNTVSQGGWTETALHNADLAGSHVLKLNNNIELSQDSVVYLRIQPQGISEFAVSVWPESDWQNRQHSESQLKVFQIGVATTLLVWSLVQWTLSRQRLYAVIGFTLVFFLGRLLTQSDQLASYLHLSIKQNHLLLLVFSIGYAMNALYLLHLLLIKPDKQTQRKKIFYAAYSATALIEIYTLLLSSSELIPATVMLFFALLALISWDFIHSLQDQSVPPSVMRLRWVVLAVAFSIFVFNVLYAFNLSVFVSQNQLLRDIFELLWIFSSILTIHLLTLIDRHSFTQRCNEASEAKKIAAQETKLRMNQQRFLSMLMHEIRTPLSVIKISTDMIIQDAPAINEKQIWVERIDVAIDNITQVIENCVQAEKHEEGLIKPQITRFLVEQELADMSSQYAQANTEYASRIEVGMDASDRNWLQTDKHYLRSMLLNLLSNAVKYSPPFTKIYLRIYKVQQQSSAKMLFEIENEIGKAGAPDESQVFQRYYRAETAKKYAGTGLGLWLSQIMAKQLGTRINMDLTPQKTIRFHFTLPIVHPQ